MSTLKLENIKHENSSTNNMVMDSDGSTRTTGTLKVDDRLQVGDASITQQFPTLGYVADFQASSGSQTYISIAEPGASTLGNNGVVIGEDTNNTYITQRGNKSINIATSDTNRVIIDGSGRVTKPHQPSFFAYMPSGNPTITSNPTKIPFSLTRFNVGNHFDTTNNRFIAPVEGKYLFQINHNVYGLSDDQYFRTRVYVNGSSYAILGYARARGGGDHTTNDSILASLSPSDYVEVFTSSNDGSYQMSASIEWTFFSGFLVS